MHACPATAAKFRRSVNLTPAEIRAWAADPRSREASFAATRRRLPALAALRGKRAGWTEADCAFASRVLSFNARMEGVVALHGCTRRAVIALRNWGRQPKGCPVPGRR